MAKTKNTKRSLIMSALALLICVSMLIGSTYAWFTDSVTSAGNKIQAGTLKLDLELLDKDTEKWNSIKESQASIFNYDLWEPGYTDVKVLKVENEGNLALKWVAKFVSNEKLSALAEVIDVYVKPSATELTYPADRNLEGYKKAGTVADFVNTIEQTTYGSLKAGEVAYLGIALKMQETAGNDYQGLSLGAFDIMILATQDTVENDSFDNLYDKDAPVIYAVNGIKYDTAEAALAAAKDGDKVQLSSLTAPITIDRKIELTIYNTNIAADEGVNGITVNADATIIADGYNSVVGGKGADGIKVASGVTLTLSGKGVLIAKGNGGSESQADYNAGKGGSGIDVEGNIVVVSLAGLTAEGYGKHAFGIGGATKSIVIKDSTVKYAKGGMVDTKIGTNYGKADNEAGAAIGSYTDGAMIEITNSTVVKAEGGSKSAGIGAMYHTGVTVKITDSNVTAYGGSSSAGIGGSRVEAKNDNITPEQTVANAVTVEIVNSKVTAVGGDFGAGIGSGYDTYCKHIDKAPLNTVKIDAASDITAQGGWLGAGIGTGHNVINFVGDIKCDTSKVKAGNSDDPTSDPFNCCWSMPTTIAENVGLGVYNIKNCLGTITEIDSADELIALGGTNVEGPILLTKDIDLDGAELKTIGVTYNKSLHFFGNGHKISNVKIATGKQNGMTNMGMFYVETGATLTVSDLTINGMTVEEGIDEYTIGAGLIGYANANSVVTLNNVDIEGTSVNNTKGNAAFYVAYTVATVNMNGCDISSDCTVNGERADKTGAFVGTANTASCVVTVTNCKNGTSATDYGRLIEGATYN